MVDQPLKSEKAPVQPRSWCVEWFGSQGDFIAGRVKEPIPLDRFAGLESLYAVGSVELARGEVSIFDSVPLIAEVQNGHARVSVDFCRRAAFLVYAIVENWGRTTVRVPIEDEQRFEEHLLSFGVESGIDVDQPFPFSVHCHLALATFTSCAISARGNTTRSCTRQSPFFNRRGVNRDHRFLFAPAPRRIHST
jgi:hypothetical protein